MNVFWFLLGGLIGQLIFWLLLKPQLDKLICYLDKRFN